MRIKSQFLAPLFVLLTSCQTGSAITIIKMPTEELIHFQTEPVIQLIHYAPQRWFEIGGPPLLGTQQGDYGRGRELAEQYSLKDPAPMVQMRFKALLEEKLQLRNLELLPQTFSEDEASTVLRTLKKGRGFTFQTTWWFIQYGWSLVHPRFHYLIYEARARLLDFRSFETYWQAVCVVSNYSEPGHTLDELKANNAALLKAQLEEAAETCARQLVVSFLDIQPSAEVGADVSHPSP